MATLCQFNITGLCCVCITTGCVQATSLCGTHYGDGSNLTGVGGLTCCATTICGEGSQTLGTGTCNYFNVRACGPMTLSFTSPPNKIIINYLNNGDYSYSLPSCFFPSVQHPNPGERQVVTYEKIGGNYFETGDARETVLGAHYILKPTMRWTSSNEVAQLHVDCNLTGVTSSIPLSSPPQSLYDDYNPAPFCGRSANRKTFKYANETYVTRNDQYTGYNPASTSSVTYNVQTFLKKNRCTGGLETVMHYASPNCLGNDQLLATSQKRDLALLNVNCQCLVVARLGAVFGMLNECTNLYTRNVQQVIATDFCKPCTATGYTCAVSNIAYHPAFDFDQCNHPFLVTLVNTGYDFTNGYQSCMCFSKYNIWLNPSESSSATCPMCYNCHIEVVLMQQSSCSCYCTLRCVSGDGSMLAFEDPVSGCFYSLRINCVAGCYVPCFLCCYQFSTGSADCHHFTADRCFCHMFLTGRDSPRVCSKHIFTRTSATCVVKTMCVYIFDHNNANNWFGGCQRDYLACFCHCSDNHALGVFIDPTTCCVYSNYFSCCGGNNNGGYGIKYQPASCCWSLGCCWACFGLGYPGGRNVQAAGNVQKAYLCGHNPHFHPNVGDVFHICQGGPIDSPYGLSVSCAACLFCTV